MAAKCMVLQWILYGIGFEMSVASKCERDRNNYYFIVVGI